MMGRSHAISGVVTGLAVAPLVGLHGLLAEAPFVVATAGYSLLPDLDHPGARVSKLVGPVTELISRGIRALSAWLYRHTKGPRDEPWTGKHRHLTHTVLFAALMGGLTIGLSALGPWWVLGVAAFGVLLAQAALGDWVLLPSVAVVIPLLLHGGQVLDALTQMRGWMGIAVALGCFTHCLGDALTRSGCPFLFPLRIAGETWYEIRPPRWLRFRTGGAGEHVVVAMLVIAAVLLIPGVWQHIHTFIQSTAATDSATSTGK
jgi:membrane-bound metal-dependent hydrolase YbcI (DUF457 family)